MAVKVETERQPGSRVVLSVEVPVDQVSTSIERAYQKLAPRVRIAGFRPGKAPRPMVERQIGWPTLRQEALDLLLPTAYNAALDEAGLDPIDVPRVEVEQFDRDLPFRFKATVSIKPEVTLGDYSDIRVSRSRTEVSDADLKETLERLQARYAELHAVERPVQKGDFLSVDVHLVKGGAVLIGESQTDVQLEVDPDRLLPGLAEGLLGQVVGETRDIRLTLPADYPKADLAGSQVSYRVSLKSAKERRLPALDDELAKQMGQVETLAELRQEVLSDLQDAAARSDQQRFENEVLKALDERTRVELPEALIDREVNREIRELELRLTEQGVRFDRYLEYTKTTLEALRAERRPQAIQKVRLELALEAVAERERLAVSEQEVDTAVSQALSEDQDLSRRADDLRSADPVRAYFRRQLLMRKSIDHLAALAAEDQAGGAPLERKGAEAQASANMVAGTVQGERREAAEPAGKAPRRKQSKKER